MDTTTLAERLDISEEAASKLNYMDGSRLIEHLESHFRGEPENYRVIDFEITTRHYSEEHSKEISENKTSRRRDHRLQNEVPAAAHTIGWHEHPEDYDGPCLCSSCLSHAGQAEVRL